MERKSRLETQPPHNVSSTNTLDGKHSSQHGFVLVSLVVLVPLLLTVFLSLAGGMWALRRRSAAHAFCVRSVVQLQAELKNQLETLLGMNPRAEILRHKRQVADQNWQTALASGYPPAIAIATAARAAVILEQTLFRAKQEALLTSATLHRHQAHARATTEIGSKIRSTVHAKSYFWRGLAVEPKPALSLTPNFVPVRGFSSLQQFRLWFTLNLSPKPITGQNFTVGNQQMECAATLVERSSEWKIQILPANASLNWL